MDDPPIPLAAQAASSGSVVGGGDWSSLLWVVGLLAVNAFFVAVEFSLVSARRSRMTQLASEGNRQAALVKQAQEELEQALSTTQLGITVASVLLGWIGATQVAHLLQAGLAPLPFDDRILESIALVLTFILLTYLQIVLGELLPKTLAIVYAESISLKLAWLNHFVSRLLKPFVEVPRYSSRLLLRLLGGPDPDPASLYSTMTAEELQLVIASSVESGGIEEEERELLANVFEFGETVASEVMVPRTSIAAVASSAQVRDVLLEVAESGYSRYPVFGKSLDDIVGLIHIKDLVGELAKNSLHLDSEIASVVRKALFVHENKLIAELLPEMQQHHRAMVIVVDEFGGTAGLITIKDIVEEIVGTLSDDSEEGDEEPDIQVVDEHTLLIQAQMSIEELQEKVDLELPIHDDYQTLGGFLIYQLQRIPKVGEKLTYQELEFQVIKMEGPRLDRVKVTRPPVQAVSESPTSSRASSPVS